MTDPDAARLDDTRPSQLVLDGLDAFQRLPPAGAPCAVCGVDTQRAAEQYMVHDQLWAAAGMPSEQGWHYLCVGCLEQRLGRTLTPADFTDVPLNDPAGHPHSPRLLDRLTRRHTR